MRAVSAAWDPGTVIRRSIIMGNDYFEHERRPKAIPLGIGKNCQIENCILDKNVRIPEDALIGYDLANDRRLYHVTESGIVVIEGGRSSVDISTMQI